MKEWEIPFQSRIARRSTIVSRKDEIPGERNASFIHRQSRHVHPFVHIALAGAGCPCEADGRHQRLALLQTTHAGRTGSRSCAGACSTVVWPRYNLQSGTAFSRPMVGVGAGPVRRPTTGQRRVRSENQSSLRPHCCWRQYYAASTRGNYQSPYQQASSL